MAQAVFNQKFFSASKLELNSRRNNTVSYLEHSYECGAGN
jgi:hypothetical protein